MRAIIMQLSISLLAFSASLFGQKPDSSFLKKSMLNPIPITDSVHTALKKPILYNDLNDDSLVYHWKYLGQPWGAKIEGLYKGLNGTIICKTSYDGYYKSQDDSIYWEHFEIGLPDWEGTLQVGLNRYYYMANRFLYASENLTNWEYVATLSGNNLHTTRFGIIYVLGDTSINYSTDYGESWNLAHYPRAQFKYVNLRVTSEGTIYCMIQENNIWYLYSKQQWDAPWILEYNENTGSVDIRATFNVSMLVLPDSMLIYTDEYDPVYLYTFSTHSLEVLYERNIKNLRLTSDNVLWRYSLNGVTEKSRDYGKTWKSVYAGEISGQISLGGFVYLADVNRKIRMTKNGGENWERSDTGLRYNVLVSIGVTKSNDIYVGSVTDYFIGELNVLKSGSHSWQQVTHSGLSGPQWDIIVTDKYLFTRNYSDIMRLNLSNNAWGNISNNTACGNSSNPTKYSLNYYSGGYLLCGLDNCGLMKRPVSGGAWSSIRKNMPRDYVFFTGENHAGDLLTRTWANGWYMSSDLGQTWSEINLYLPSTYRFALGPRDSIFAATEGGLYISSNDGNTWHQAFSDYVWDVLYDSTQGLLFASVNNVGLLVSQDKGSTWEDISANEYFTGIRALTMNSSGDLLVSTERGGVYKAHFVDENDEKPPAVPIPQDFAITSIYPNPTNGNITIDWIQSFQTSVSISILDITGREVYTRKPVPFGKGEHSTTIQLNDFPSGIYFAQIAGNSNLHTHKFLVIE